jgi:hypothetical protein
VLLLYSVILAPFNDSLMIHYIQNLENLEWCTLVHPALAMPVAPVCIYVYTNLKQTVFPSYGHPCLRVLTRLAFKLVTHPTELHMVSLHGRAKRNMRLIKKVSKHVTPCIASAGMNAQPNHTSRGIVGEIAIDDAVVSARSSPTDMQLRAWLRNIR